MHQLELSKLRPIPEFPVDASLAPQELLHAALSLLSVKSSSGLLSDIRLRALKVTFLHAF